MEPLAAHIDYKALYEQSQLDILQLRQELDQLKKMIFGSRQERIVAGGAEPAQLAMGLEPKMIAATSLVKAKKIEYTRSQSILTNPATSHPGRNSTITDWVSNTCKLITPLYEALAKEVLAGDYLHADETPIKVVDKDKKGESHRGYFWVYHNSLQDLVLFDYQPGRGREGLPNYLKTLKGTCRRMAMRPTTSSTSRRM